MSITGDNVAVIGMAGRFPGANNVAELWDNLCAGRDCVRTLSDDELRAAGVPESDINSSSYVKAAAVLDDVDKFDAAFFKVSPLEAELMDPQIRLLLQCAWETLEDAGYAGREARNIGVFAGAGGVTTSYFANFVNLERQFEKITASPTHLANDKDFLATYLSYKLNLTGPSVTVQTACSTSLVALHQARLSLLSGECDMALAGGVTVRVPHGHGYHYKEGYIFSKSGRVRTFDAAADGVVFGSGLGLVLIKRLEDAIRDGDNIHAVIRGSAIANDGKAKMSYAASSAKGQMACIRTALTNAGVHPGSIGFVETHGTGTAMGDPEEVKALTAVFKGQTDRKQYCGLGSVKTNVGHLEAAAGIVGFIKAVLAVKHGVIPPTVHYSKPNPRIKFESSPFYVNTTPRAWEGGSDNPRRAGVNCLGVGGTNAFVVVEEFTAPRNAPRARAPKPVIVPLSARTPSSLREYAQKLCDFLAKERNNIDIVDLAYTLQIGREAMEHRAAFVVCSLDELQQRLQQYLESCACPETPDEVAAWFETGDIDWQKRYPAEKPKRISLPTYAFAKERHWIDNAPVHAAARARLHPLLHENTSELSEHRYSSTFNGDEFFLRDHLVRMQSSGQDEDDLARKVLPGVAYLEMARAAFERAVANVGSKCVELRDVVWVQPILVVGERRVSIALAPNEDRVGFEVFSDDQGIHCQGQVRHVDVPKPVRLDVHGLKQSMQAREFSAAQIYPALARMGLAYGPAHQALTHIYMSERGLLARLELPGELVSSQGDFVLHPSLLDGALQATIALQVGLDAVPDAPMVPFALEYLRVHASCTAEMHAWVRHAADSHTIDLDLCDAEGNVCVEMRGFVARAFGKEGTGRLLATEVWRPAPATHGVPQGERHVMLCDMPDVDAERIDASECTKLPLAEGSIADRYTAVAMACFDKLQSLIQSKTEQAAHLQLVLPNVEVNHVFAGLAGMFKTATLENPRITGQIVFAQGDADTVAAQLRAEHANARDTVVSYQSGMRKTRVWQLLPATSSDPSGALFEDGGAFKDRGVYLITGGLGGLGALFAREILGRSPNARIVLTGRATLEELKKSPAKSTLLDSLKAVGAVDYRQLLPDDLDHVRQCIASVRQQYGQLNGIIHSAGMTADGFILKKDADTFRKVLAPKVAGTLHLDEATRELDLDFLVLFSSLSSAVGNVGQADYAAANGFMDQFAEWRNRQVAKGARHGRTLTIRWPLWREGGMQLDRAGREMLRESTGIRPMQTAAGLQAFYRILASDCDQALVMEGDLHRMQQLLCPAPAQAQLHAIGATSVEATDDLVAPTEEYLQKQLAGLLKLPPHKIDVRAPLEDYGMNSILALDFTRALERTFGPLSKTLFFEYLTLRDLAGYFVKAHAAKLNELFARFSTPSATAPAEPRRGQIASIRKSRSLVTREQPSSTQEQVREATHADEPIAIVGLSGRYPESPDIEALWRNLRDGKDCIVEVPRDRWDWRDYYSEDRTQKGKHFSKWGGFIEGVDEFDARFFNISPVEAETIDPQERLFLQHAWMAIEDAGYTRASLMPGEVGVYAGVMYGEYQLLGAEASLLGNRMGFASNLASIANRVSYVLNLHGPSMAVDTMCSSSLTAIHLACQDLRLGRTTAAIAGGVNVTIHPNKYLMLSAGQFISGDGHCQSFGEGGDGYIPGEGVGVVVLKRLSDALRDGNHIYGVIRGSALSHGGKTNGYTVPNPQAQASAIRQALAQARVHPRHISYIEAHGTGTKLGDPIEIAALTKVFQEHTADTGFCLIGSAKSNIGHCEAAAGIAGLTKVLLQLKHRSIVPSLHSSRLNPHIDFSSTPFVVNQTLRVWEQPIIDGKPVPRIAGISSFGAGGSNAHLVVEEYVQPVTARSEGVEVIVPLSARTAEQLERKVRDLLDFVRREQPLDLTSLAYTLQVGREAMDERVGFIVRSVEQLAERLQAYLEGRAHVEGMYVGQVKANKEALALLTQDPDLHATIDKWIAGGKLSKLLDLWVRGLDLDWQKLYAVRPSLISLPTYPFARQKFWVNVGRSAGPARLAAGVIHPLLHVNTSDFNQQSYTSTFRGDEAFLAGEPGSKTLSGAACLEMVRAAVEKSLPAPSETSILELRNIRWALPAPPVAGKPVTLALFDNTEEKLRFELFTKTDAQEIVLCQGEAIYVERPVVRPLDLTTIRREEPARLATLSLPDEQATGEFALHPQLFSDVLRRAVPGATELAHPVEIACVRIIFTVGRSVLAWIRDGSEARTVDVDLCDEQGAVCLQLRGMRYPQPAIEPRVGPERQAASEPAKIDDPVKVAIEPPPSTSYEAATLRKPSGIVLATPGFSASTEAAPTTPRARIALASAAEVGPTASGNEAGANPVELLDHRNGVFEIRMMETTLSDAVIEHLLRAMAAVGRATTAKVLMIRGSGNRFLTGAREAHHRAVERKLYRAIAEFPYPVIAVMHGDATGAGFMVAAVCDFIVCSETANYGFSDAAAGLLPAPVQAVFEERFGRTLAADFLYFTPMSTGEALRRKGWTCPIVPPEQVDSEALSLANSLAAKSQKALKVLKRHLSRHLLAKLEDVGASELGSVPARIPGDVVADLNGTLRCIDLRADSPQVLVARIRTRAEAFTIDVLCEDLATLSARLDIPGGRACVVLTSDHSSFLPDGQVRGDAAAKLRSAVQGLPSAIIAAFTGDASSAGWLLGQLCDACIYSKSHRYSSVGFVEDAWGAGQAFRAFAMRLGEESARQILLSPIEYTGAELQGQLGVLHVEHPDQVLSSALQLAERLSNFPADGLRRWRSEGSPAAEVALSAEHGPTQQAAAVALALTSEAITASLHPEGILVVRMADRDARNMFSDAFTRGMQEVFAHVERDPACKVVVLTGYDTYFSSGGTPETLLAIHEGRARFTDNKVFELPLTCKVPVIAAMQGHGIGAGWALGMYADFTLFGEESRYVSPYMGYGFTPGAGATLIFPSRIGRDLAKESLLTAREYSGAELKRRGLQQAVLPRQQVMDDALALARQIARRSRAQLIELKSLWADALRRQLQETYEQELAMHALTFVGQPDTLALIRNALGVEAQPAAAAPRPEDAKESVAPVSEDDLHSIADTLRKLLADELRMAEQDIGDDEQFVDLGLDSITGVTWIRRINEKYGTSIEAIKVYSYPTLNQLSRYVAEEARLARPVAAKAKAVVPAMPATSVPGDASAPMVVTSLTSWRKKGKAKKGHHKLQPIAVVGMAGQFPRARNLQEFWDNIAQARDCVGEVPKERWDIDRYYQPGSAVPGKTNSKWLGALEEYDLFDAAFFNISPREARSMDPQQRLFLQACWHAIEHAGYNPRSLSGSRCGVFVGCSAGDYHQLSRREQLSGPGFTGAATSILAARISYFLDLHGPSMSIDTACSSSLVAIANACDSLISGGCDVALAGGVNVMAGPAMHIMTAQMGMLSPNGRCFTFDQRADGIATGEGVGVVMLKRLADAERDGDRIYGVVEGWGINQDGRTNGITAPNAESQARLQQEVYERFNIDPAGIQLIEAHGTGTPLGDPIEVAALKASFGKFTDRTDYCALGSVKSNIGHCLTAAGVSGFIKVLLALEHRQLPPTLHFRKLNQHISLQGSPFFVNTRLRDWESHGAEPRRAAINSFGFSGTNAHAVIAEYAGRREAVKRDQPVIVPLSAKTEDQLKQQVLQLREFIRGRKGQALSLQDVAYTLQVGREAMNERVAFIAGSIGELEHVLDGYVEGAPGERTYRGEVNSKDTLLAFSGDAEFQRMIGNWIAGNALPKLAQLWVKGLALDWNKFHPDGRLPQRTALPLYPFAKQRYWLEPEGREIAIESGHASRSAAVHMATSAPVPASVTMDSPAPVVAQASIPKPVPAPARDQASAPMPARMPASVQASAPMPAQSSAPVASASAPVQLSGLVQKPVSAAAQEAGAVQTAVPPGAAAEPAKPRITLEQLQQELRVSLAEALFMKPADIQPGKSFTELGMDSIIGVEWVKAINKQYGVEIAATRVYDYPTIKELAGYLIDRLPAPESSATASTAHASIAESSTTSAASVLAEGFVPTPAVASVPVGDFVPSAAAGQAASLPFERDETAHASATPAAVASSRGERLFREINRGRLANGDVFADYAISPETNVSLREHVVFGKHLLPTDAYIELVLSAYRACMSHDRVSLRNISIANPLLGEAGVTRYLRVVLRQAEGDVQFFVRSSAKPDLRDEMLHVQGFITTTVPVSSAAGSFDFPIERTLYAPEIPTNAGLYYAPLEHLELGAERARGLIEIAPHGFEFLANPLVLYGGLCTAINYAAFLGARHDGPSGDQFLPHRIASLAVLRDLDQSAYRCHVQLKHRDRDSVEVDFELFDAGGDRAAVVEGMSLRRVSAKAIQQQVAPAKSPTQAGRVAGAAGTEKIAIIGMSCRFPKSENVAAFWDNLRQGRDCITEVPADRWRDYQDWYHPDPRHRHTSYSKWGGFLDEIDTFDPLFFGIAPAEAEVMDPQQRIFLQECWKAIESAGYAPSALSHRSCGVYVGCSTGDYTRVLAEGGQDTVGAAFMGTSNAILAARISYYLNLKGPALAVDTACSSSLVAVHLACESIRSGENEMALAGGINLLATPLGHILTSQVGMPSPDGKCRAFDAGANGIVFSEGCGVLVLKALSQAIRDNDDILGVIEASGTNQDGKTNGITAPSSASQELLLERTYAKYGIDAKQISYVEAHGTATALGDPIEVDALASVFKKFGAERQRCALGSVKSNIGHTGFAAGVAGIIKVLLCMKHRKLVPSINYSRPNPHIAFDDSPFFVNTDYREWHSEQARLATVSSFGFSGTNAHVVVREYPQPVEAASPVTGNVIVPLSARTQEQLLQQARDLLAFLRAQAEPVDLARLSYTLQAGRDAMDYRAGFIVSSVEALAGKLQQFVDGEPYVEGIYRGQVSQDDALSLFTADASMRAVIDQWLTQRNLPKLLELWVRGFALDWERLYSGARPRRLALPTYPFAKERYWVAPSRAHRKPESAGEARLHPLVHVNTSDLSQQGYSTVLAGDEFFLVDHRVDGQKMLPAVAYLEMARAAIKDAMPLEQTVSGLELRHVAWAQPIVVTEHKRITIAVFAESAEQVNFEIYSQDGEGGEVMHCQGQGVLCSERVEKIDLDELRRRMTRGAVDKQALYAKFAGMGLEYGATFQGITAVHRGEGELLAELQLTDLPQATEYVLHPSLMDSALQGSICLIEDVSVVAGKPPLPFALESLRIGAPCQREMAAFVRYSEAGRVTTANLVKVDIDLCDLEGNVCVQMRGFSSRPMESGAAFDEAHYQSIIAGVLSRKLSADEAEALG